MELTSERIFDQKAKSSVKVLLRPYLRHWKWFVACVILGIICAYLYLRYATPEYAVGAKIQILTSQSSASELGALKELDLLTSGNTPIFDEIEILSSRSNLIEVARRLSLNIKIMAQGNIHDSELYQDHPFNLNFLIPDSLVFLAKENFELEILSDTSFSIRSSEKQLQNIYSFGTTIDSETGEFVITPNDPNMNRFIGNSYLIIIEPLIVVAQSYKDKLQINAVEDFSNIVSIGLNDPVPQKGIDIVNTLVQVYNENAIDDKKKIADKTSVFIDERILEIYGDLSTVDQTAEEFKSGRGITDVASQSNINLNISARNQQELKDANIQLNITSSMKNIVDNQAGYEVLPSNIGLSDPTIANTTAKYNELVLERNRLLKSSNERNPIIVNLDEQLEGLKKSLRSSLNSTENNLSLQVNNLSRELSRVNARIYAAPGNERALRDITRQQQTTEALYLYLLQKREESQIAFASAAPKSAIIERAYQLNNAPVLPKKKIIILASVLMGLLLPFTVIYLGDLIDDKIHNMHDLEELASEVPLLGELPRLSKKGKKMVIKDDRSVLSEALRIIRTNIDFLLNTNGQDSEKNNVIFVTSSVPGEGKTFLSTNLAMIFASTNKKVLLIGGDIRNPRFYTFFTGDKVDRLKTGSGKN